MRKLTTTCCVTLAVFLLVVRVVDAQQPNVLWILTDDQRYDSIGAFNRILHDRDHSELGYVESPNVDHLAALGTTFINTYCQAQGCAPSRASMHYGRYPFRSGVYEFEYHNNNAEHCRPTLPEQMASLGYQTVHVGKLGVRVKTVDDGRVRGHQIYQTDVSFKRMHKDGLTGWGKDWFYELDGVKLSPPIKQMRFFVTPDGKFEYASLELEERLPRYAGSARATMKKYDLLRHYNAKKPRAPDSGMILAGVSSQPAGKTRDGWYSTVFVNCLKNENRSLQVGSRTVEGVDSSKPLFCHLGFDFPHTPVLPPAEYRARFQEHVYRVPTFEEDEFKTMPRQLRRQVEAGYTDHFTNAEKQAMVQDYFAFCAYGDTLVGQAADAFVEYSEKHNQAWVIVYVCGDHGWKLNDHGAVSKFTPWNIDSHNPIIVVSSDKKAFPAGKVVRDFTEFVDIAPTILAAGGADLDDDQFDYLDGLDLAKVASGEVPVRDYVIGESHAVTGPRAYIRTKDYVLSLQTRPDKRRGVNMDWAMNASFEELDPALYHTPSDPHEVNNLAFDKNHQQVAMKLKDKLLNIVMGDDRIEVDWGPKGDGTKVHRSNFAPGAHDGKLSSTPGLNARDLSKEGREQKAIHDYLFGTFVEGRETKYVAAGRERGLKEVTILAETKEIRHGDEVLLPEGAERVAGLFRHFAFHGDHLDRIREVHVFPFSPDKAPPRSQQVKGFYRVQMPSIPLSDHSTERMTIRFLMKTKEATCRIDDLVFIAQKQIPPEFDTIAYRDLGSEYPRKRVELRIDTDHELSIGGTTELQRDRWFRMHETPGTTDPSFEKWAAQRGFLPGRGAFKFNPALTRGWGRGETLKEREDRPGEADLTFFDRYDAGERLRRAIPLFREKPFACCFNDWPEFMSVPLVGRGTPLPKRFDDAAELAAAYVADQIKDAGYTAAWWEVKNESSVQSEWAHHWKEKQGIDGWGLLADFHNRVADAVHARAPDVKVGGPSSAYMQLQVKDFALYRNQARFIEETRGHIDFFSHHFYENALMVGAHERRGLGYSNYLLGRYEAILDMLRAHMHKVDNVLPILITECGSLQNGRQPSDNWLRLLAWNAYLTKSMQRPDQIELFVPFIFLHMSWNPYSGDAAFTPKADRERHSTIEDFEPTTVAHYFDLWRDFDGRRLRVDFDRDWLDVVAVHDGKRISLAVTNMGGRQIAVDLSRAAKTIEATGATQTRLNYHQGAVIFEPEHAVDVTAIPVDVNETTVIRLVLDEPFAPLKKVQQQRWYATDTAIASDGNPLSFNIKVEIESLDAIESARLIIGIYRRGGITEPLAVDMNGTPVTVDTGDADEFTEFFAPLDAAVPSSLLRNDNAIVITAQPGTTITSVQLVTHRLVD